MLYGACSNEPQMNNENSADILLCGKVIEVLLFLIGKEGSAVEIADRINVPVMLVPFYMETLLKEKLVTMTLNKDNLGNEVATYRINKNEINILNHFEFGKNDEKLLLSYAYHFTDLIQRLVLNIAMNKGSLYTKFTTNHVITTHDNMQFFQQRLADLITEFKTLGVEKGDSIYTLISVLAPTELCDSNVNVLSKENATKIGYELKID